MTIRKVWSLTMTLVLTFIITSGCAPVLRKVATFHHVPRKIFGTVPMDKAITGYARTNSIGEGTNKIAILHLYASDHYSFGYQAGRTIGPAMQENITAVYTSLSRVLKDAVPILPKFFCRFVVNVGLDGAWNKMRPFVPQAELDEMQGLADGLRDAGIKNISIEQIHRLMALPDLTEATCSAMILKGTNGHWYQVRILDYGVGSGLEKNPLITVYHSTREGENTFVSIGWAGFTGLVSGRNEKGVAISEMGLGSLPGETLAGIPMIFLLKLLMRYADNAEAAVSIIRSAQRNNAYAYGVGDSSGNGYGLITSRTECHIYPMNKTSEIRFGEMVMPQYKDIIYAGHNWYVQGKLMEQRQGKLDLESVKDINKYICMNSNLQVVIYDLTTGDIWIANAHGKTPASFCEYVLFPLSMWELDRKN